METSGNKKANLEVVNSSSQRKSWLLALASGLMVLVVLGWGLFHESSATSAATTATATRLTYAQAIATAQVNATRDKATWLAIAEYAPDKATQEAIQQLTVTFLPTDTPFDKMATVEALDKWLTTSPTPDLRESGPTLFFQRPAGVGRLILPHVITCGYNLKCMAKDFWMEKTKDKFVVVYAGRRFNDETNSLEALVYMEWLSLSNQEPLPTGGGVFLAPIPAQDMRIVDVIGEQLTLCTEAGTLLLFDVPSRQYISVPQPQLTARTQHRADGGTVVENRDVPFALPRFSAVNRWSGENANGWVTVFAGAEGGSNNDFRLGKGVLAVVTSRGEPSAADTPQLYYPPDAGALWIFDVKGNLVFLVGQGGGIFFFDLAARQFVSEEEAWPKLFTAPLFDENMSIANATPQPVTPFVPPTPVSTPVPSAYPAYP